MPVVFKLMSFHIVIYFSDRGSTSAEVCDGIREYFNVLLGTQLLYKCERVQYAEVSDPWVALAPFLLSLACLLSFLKCIDKIYLK